MAKMKKESGKKSNRIDKESLGNKKSKKGRGY